MEKKISINSDFTSYLFILNCICVPKSKEGVLKFGPTHKIEGRILDLCSQIFRISSILYGGAPPLLDSWKGISKSSLFWQNASGFTEEFDFEAMNEKFNKDEVWGHLGKANQRYKTEGTHENGTSSQDLMDDDPFLVSKSEPKPAYNKDNFLDTISCNSIGREARDGENRFSGRMSFDSETFGNFHQRAPIGYHGYGGGRGRNRDQYNSGRGHNYGNRGHGYGGFTQR